MTRSARRRWARELDHEVDGLALGPTGPVLVHGYEPPAGGRWIDNAIPGKVTALDRQSGDLLWTSPCEVGYGRGFGAGFGADGDAVLVGPSAAGHRIVRMSLESGELIAMSQVPAFDEAVVGPDLTFLVSARKVSAVDSSSFEPRWTYAREGERYHILARREDVLLVVYTQNKLKRQGLLRLDAKTGKPKGALLEPSQKSIHDLAYDDVGAVTLVANVEAALPREQALELLMQDDGDAGLSSGLGLVAFDPSAKKGDTRALWFETLDTPDDEDFPEVAIFADSGKLYLVRGALLEVRDALTGRGLGDWVVPGLDERVGWRVCDGAGLLAEEQRVSVFELPA